MSVPRVRRLVEVVVGPLSNNKHEGMTRRCCTVTGRYIPGTSPAPYTCMGLVWKVQVRCGSHLVILLHPAATMQVELAQSHLSGQQRAHMRPWFSLLFPPSGFGAHWHQSQLTEVTASNIEIGIFHKIFILIDVSRQRAGALPLDESDWIDPETRKPHPTSSVMETDTPPQGDTPTSTRETL